MTTSTDDTFTPQSTIQVFTTPLIAHNWPDSEGLNRELAELILAREAASSGLRRSNVGGWHSTNDLFDWPEAAARAFHERVLQLVKAATRGSLHVREGERTFHYKLEGWANVSRRGNYNQPHNHPNSLWSGVYYVQSGRPDADASKKAGKLELLDPRVSANMCYPDDNTLQGQVIVEPLPGLMVLFPSWLQHIVHPFQGEGERISIAFNAGVVEATDKKS